MYQVTTTYGHYSVTITPARTMADACNILAEQHAFYAHHENRHSFVETICEDCSSGRRLACRAPKRHARGNHATHCYKVCKTCQGEYLTRVEA